MLNALKDWRTGIGRWVVATVLVAGPAVVCAAADAPKSDAAQDVDPATKNLMAANGLYQRQLYKLAADAYKEFLDQNPRHEQVSAAQACAWRFASIDREITPGRSRRCKRC